MLGVVLVNPGWVKAFSEVRYRGFNTWREWNGLIGKSTVGLVVRWAHARKNCDVPMPSHRQ